MQLFNLSTSAGILTEKQLVALEYSFFARKLYYFSRGEWASYSERISLAKFAW